ncbi:DNA-(apurinic or apyrimidinic site) endonuclease 2 isoform X2 [Hyperolius riggenbachi]|uniref:DNA-(apurinic or apyrimidinic site) endonuclease 2 isoform X2 n=1 Tax=Hyperolius riggenbachi TaxID=752182 RepID=UPI0035A35236
MPHPQRAHCKMKIVSWNINGIRATRMGLKDILDSLDADIICLQETKVTRDLLDEPTAIVEGYNSYFSFSRVRSGYSGVATFCKSNAVPCLAEEGLSGLLSNQKGTIGCYGNTEEFSEEEQQSLDQEGRTVITQHKILTSDDKEETLTVVNVYCPRADPEKPERKTYKLRFYRLLQIRAEAILQHGSHVIILGDVNTSHKPLDHCDPNDLETFEENPGRQWLNQFLSDPLVSKTKDGDPPEGGLFMDSFRYFHPNQKNAFTCWCSASGARQTNYGTRIDYILGNRTLVETEFLDSVIMPEIEGSDHCPVKAFMKCRPIAADRCPPLCTKFLPEFAGRQQKLSQFLVKKSKDFTEPSREKEELSSSQSSNEGPEVTSSRKRAPDKVNGIAGKKNKVDIKSGQSSLLGFFKPAIQKTSSQSQDNAPKLEGQKNLAKELEKKRNPSLVPEKGNRQQAAFWKSLLKGPPPPPNCKGHAEPCVLRTVKKAGPNCGRQFYVCARPEGHSSNPQARCNFFLWRTLIHRGLVHCKLNFLKTKKLCSDHPIQ